MFELVWTKEATDVAEFIRNQAIKTQQNRIRNKKKKSSPQDGLYKQILKTLKLLKANPRHPSLKTHEFSSLQSPLDNKAKVFEAYVQNKTPGAYRVFWCYGPDKNQITVIAITPHP